MKQHSCDRPILIGCCPSSGSTLLSLMLDAHPEVICGPELGLFSHPFFWRESGAVWRKKLAKYFSEDLSTLKEWSLSQGACPYINLMYYKNIPWYGHTSQEVIDLILATEDAKHFAELFYHNLLAKLGKTIWAEKTPPNIYSILDFLQAYPQGKAIVLVRDGRDTICSLLDRGYSFADASAIWLVESSISWHAGQAENVLLIRYEDLITDTKDCLANLVSFLDISPNIESMLQYMTNSARAASDKTITEKSVANRNWLNQANQPVRISSIGRWKKELSPAQLSFFKGYKLNRNAEVFGLTSNVSVGDMLEALGYQHLDLPSVAPEDLKNFFILEKSILGHQMYLADCLANCVGHREKFCKWLCGPDTLHIGFPLAPELVNDLQERAKASPPAHEKPIPDHPRVQAIKQSLVNNSPQEAWQRIDELLISKKYNENGLLNLAISIIGSCPPTLVLKILLALLKENNRNAMAHSMTGAVFFMMGDIAKAKEAFQRSFFLEPGSANISNNYVKFLNSTGQPEQALAVLKNAFKFASGDDRKTIRKQLDGMLRVGAANYFE